jgi:hypothetical protein
MKTLRSTLAALALGLATLTAFAAPSPEAVQEAIRAQNWTQAQSMLTEVTRDKPNSAKAWYYLAQTEEKLGHPSAALADLQRAEKLQPDLKFASPGAVKTLEARLSPTVTQSYPTTAAPTHVITAARHDSGMALFWILGIMLVCGLSIWAIYRLFLRPSTYISGNGVHVGNGGVGMVGGGYPGPGYAGGGSTVVVNNGNNGTGLLGTMLLADALSDHHHHDSYRDSNYSSPAASSWDNTPAASPSPSSFDLGGGSSSSWDSGSSSSGFDGGGSSSGGSDW